MRRLLLPGLLFTSAAILLGQSKNLEETADCKGNWIKASVASDGKFTVTNGRNGFSKTYVSR